MKEQEGQSCSRGLTRGAGGESSHFLRQKSLQEGWDVVETEEARQACHAEMPAAHPHRGAMQAAGVMSLKFRIDAWAGETFLSCL